MNFVEIIDSETDEKIKIEGRRLGIFITENGQNYGVYIPTVKLIEFVNSIQQQRPSIVAQLDETRTKIIDVYKL